MEIPAIFRKFFIFFLSVCKTGEVKEKDSIVQLFHSLHYCQYITKV